MSQVTAPNSILLTFDECDEGTTRLDLMIGAEEVELEEDAYFSFSRPLQVNLTVHRSVEMFTLTATFAALSAGNAAAVLWKPRNCWK